MRGIMRLLPLLLLLAAPVAHARTPSVLWLMGVRVTSASHAIFLPVKPTPTERTAAGELRWHLEQITGVSLLVLPETQRGGRHGFYIGQCIVVHPLPADELAALGEEGLLLRTVGRDLLLAGNRRGVIYAVSTFLDEELGCRWLASDHLALPTARTLRVSRLHRRYIPRLAYRYTDYADVHRNPRFAMRLRINADQYRPNEAHPELGGFIRFYPFCHTFGELVPPAQYFETHPEYFSMVDGKRRRDNTQLCLTNPDVLRIATAQVRRWIAERPDARYYDVSINDAWEESACSCPECRAVDAREGSRAGTLVYFLNAIADDIRAEYLDKMISTLAYNYTQAPPRFVKPRENVLIRLCSYHCSFARPLAGDDYRDTRQFRADLAGWAKISRHLMLWDYTVNFGYALAPFPNLDVLQPNLRYFLTFPVDGVYEQGSYYSAGTELAPLRAYVIAKLLWNPDYPEQQAIREFTDGYYGQAAPYLRQYLALLQERVRRDPALKIGVGTTYGTRDGLMTNAPADYLPADFLPRAQALFAQARRAAAKDPVALSHVRQAQAAVLSLLLQGKAQYRRDDDRLVESDVPGVTDWADELRRAITETGLTRAWEQGPLDPLLAHIKRLPPALRIVRLRTRELTVELLPEFGGEIITLRGRDGRNRVRVFGEPGRVQPEDSGIKDFSATAYNSPGWCEAFQVTECSDRAVTLRAVLSNGLTLERTLSLEGAALRIRSALTNTSADPRPARLRVHAVFGVTDPNNARLRWQATGGAWQEAPLPGIGTPGGDRRLSGPDLPTAWGFSEGTAQLTNRLLAGDIDSAYCWVDPPNRWLTLELWSPVKTLQTGERLIIEHAYEVI